MSDNDQIEHRTREERRLLENLTQILFFPSWSKLIGNEDFKGTYLNQPVYEIIKDNVALLPDLILTGIEKTSGEPYIFLTGAGVYYIQFRLEGYRGSYLTDHREINGIILPLEVYEKAKDVTGSLIDSDKLMMTEYITAVPFSLILAKQTTQMYLRGVVSRNVIHPYKDCFNQLLTVCNNSNSLNQQQGYKILSGGLSTSDKTICYNEILTEAKLNDYSKVTAGIKSISPKAHSIIHDFQLDESKMKNAIFEKIRLIKHDFVNIGYPKLLDWIP